MKKILFIFNFLLCFSITTILESMDKEKNSIIEWKGKTNTNYDAAKLSLYIGNSNSFIQVNDSVSTTFPLLRNALIQQKKYVRLYSLSTKNASLVHEFLQLNLTTYQSFLDKIAIDDLNEINWLINELNGKEIVKQFSDIVTTENLGTPNALDGITEDNRYLTYNSQKNRTKIAWSIAQNIPFFKKNANTISLTNNTPLGSKEVLELINHYILLYHQGAHRSLIESLNTFDIQIVQQAFPILKNLYGDYLIGFYISSHHTTKTSSYFSPYFLIPSFAFFASLIYFLMLKGA